MHLIPNCFKMVFIWLFFSSVPLSERHTMEAPALHSIPDKYASMTEFAVLSSIGTAMT